MHLTQLASAALMTKLPHSSVKYNHFTSFHRCNPTGSAEVSKPISFIIDQQKSYNVVVL